MKQIMIILFLKAAIAVMIVIICIGNVSPPSPESPDNVELQSSSTFDKRSLRREILGGRRLDVGTSRNSSPGRLFGCGGAQLYPNSYGIMIVTDIFPHMNPTIYPAHNIDEIKDGKATANDICVFYVDYCDLDPDDFPGKTLVVSGHPEYRFGVSLLPSGSRTYYLGPKADSAVSIRLPFAAMLLMTRSRLRAPQHREMMKVINPEKKTKNSLEHFLLYAVSGKCVDFREDAFDKLSRIRVVHYIGNCHGNEEGVGNRKVLSPYATNQNVGASNIYEIYPHYRYALVMENELADGYISEKILDAFVGGAVPIWYGTREVFDMFNSKAFIYYDIQNPDEALERITYLEQHIDAYEQMLNEPILAEGHRTVEKYFSFRPDYGNGSLGRRIRSMMGYDSHMYHYSLLQKGEGLGGTDNVPRFVVEG